MSARMVWLSTTLVLAAAPASAQIGERAREARQRPSVDVVVTIPGRPDTRDRNDRDRSDRGRADRNDRDRYDRDHDRYDDRDWRSGCRYEGRRGGRDRDHDWYDRDGRWDCGADAYREDRFPVRWVDRSLVRSHADLQLRLDREHDRWHRAHGWNPRNRGWDRAHLALHERLEREHELWHRRLGAPYVFWFDRPAFNGRPGLAIGVSYR